MALPFKEQKKIRDLHRDGKTQAEIARLLKHDAKTVRKYIEKDDFSPPSCCSPKNRGTSKLDPYTHIIDKWLEGDLSVRKKQRHTATRVYERLSEEAEGFNCSRSLVLDYVRQKKAKLELGGGEPRLPLEHAPGEAQADFGEADFIVGGKAVTGKYLALSFPYSNAGFIRLNYGENMECLLEGLDSIFREVGGVPYEIWFDNGSAMVKEVICGGRSIPCERFERFAEHYGFRIVFMNVLEPEGKGSVEAKVGYTRRHWLVPPPEAESLDEINERLFERARKDHGRNHYKKGERIDDLLEKDKSALGPLPEKAFPLFRTEIIKAGKTGMVEFDNRFYSTSPDCAEKKVSLRITSSEVTAMDEDFNVIVTHKRLYGRERESKEWGPYLKAIQFKPRTLPNTGIPELLGEKARSYVLGADGTQRTKAMRILFAMAEKTGFEAALAAFSDYFEEEGEGMDARLDVLFAAHYPDEAKCKEKEPRTANGLDEYDRLLRKRNKEENQ